MIRERAIWKDLIMEKKTLEGKKRIGKRVKKRERKMNKMLIRRYVSLMEKKKIRRDEKWGKRRNDGQDNNNNTRKYQDDGTKE